MDGLIFGILRYLFAGYREKSRATRKKTWGEMQGKKGELSFAPPLAALPLARAFSCTSSCQPSWYLPSIYARRVTDVRVNTCCKLKLVFLENRL